MLAVLKNFYTEADYRRGSLMDLHDLARVKASYAAAVILLADTAAAEPDSADALNIMGVISIKDLRNEIPVLVQVSSSEREVTRI